MNGCSGSHGQAGAWMGTSIAVLASMLALASACALDEGTRDLGPTAQGDRVDEAACVPVRSWNRHAGSDLPFQVRVENAVASAALPDGGIAAFTRVVGFGRDAVFGDIRLPSHPQSIYPAAITRLDRSGNFVWAKTLIDGNMNGFEALAQGGGVIAIASTINVGAAIDGVETYALPPVQGQPAALGDVFLGALDLDGNVLWTRVLGTNTSSDYATAMVVDALGNTTVAVQRLGSPRDTELVQLDAAGEVRWRRASDTVIYDLRIASDGTLVAGGNIATATGHATVARLDPDDGRVLWAAGDASVDPPVYHVAASPTGEVLAAGRFAGNAVVAGHDLVAAGAHDLFVAAWSEQGEPLRAWSLGGSSDEFVHSLDVDGQGDVIVGMVFDAETASGPFSRVSAGSWDVALAYFDAAGIATALVPIATGPGYATLGDVAVNEDDEVYVMGGWRGNSEFGPSNGAEEMFFGRLRCADAEAPLRLRDVTAVRRDGAVDRTQYFCAQSSAAWNNCKAVHLLGATGSTYDYPGASYDGWLMVGHTFGARAQTAFSTTIDYLAPDGTRESITADFPAFDTSDDGGKMLFYVADDGSTYYADAEHDGYHYAGEVLTPAQAMVPEHLARRAGQ